MTVVVDASVLVAAVVDTGAEGRWCEELVATSSFVAPALVLAEAGNILRRLESAGQSSRLEAGSAHESLLALDIRLFPYEPLASRIWDLRHNLTAYDAWYVALAESLAMPLATLDRRLSRASGPECRFLLPEMG